MPSLASRILPVFGLPIAFVAGLHSASAAVTRIGQASFEVSAQVVTSCVIDMGASAATTSATCGGARSGVVRDVATADLSQPTVGELSSAPGTHVVEVVY